ncbi:40S ribosomal protein S4 [Mortierella sp. AM989]|nr:40S ribosomal protein S4 [Mortierella sp. AM989]
MSLENTSPIALANTSSAETAVSRHRKSSVDSGAAKTRREAVALDGQMFESFESGSSSQDRDASHESVQQKLSEDTFIASNNSMTDTNEQSGDRHIQPETDSQPRGHKKDAVMEIATSNNDKSANPTNPEVNDSQQQTTLSSSSSVSSSSSSSSTSSSPGKLSPAESPAREMAGSLPLLDQDITALQDDLAPPPLGRSLSQGKRQSMFLGDHISISQDGPVIESPSSQSPGSNDDQEDMKEVQIETTDPSHLFWVPFHLHPEIAPNEYNKWLYRHGVDSVDSDGIIPSRKTSVSRRKSVLSAQYNPEEDQEDQPSKPITISEENEDRDFLSGVFSASLEQVDQPPLKTKTSIRRSVSLSASSPTKEYFPMDAEEESILAVKRPGGLERGGLSLLRRSARTKIRRNSTASNEFRPDVSRLRQTVNANGEYPPVSLVDPGPLPLPSSSQQPGSTPTASADTNSIRKDGDTQPFKRFVSTLRDSSKPTITTYVEPHLLEQQRKENEEANRDADNSPSNRVSAPGKLENSAAARLLAETIENDRKESPENFTVSYPIPPPVKLSQNLLQQPSSQQSPTSKAPTSPSSQPILPPFKQKNSGQAGQAGPNGTPTHAKKPSTWSWLWGKEKGGEKAADSLVTGGNVSMLSSAKSPSAIPGASAEINTQTSPNEVSVKKQSTLSMLFSRNGKSSSKAHATTAESTHSVTTNSGQSQSSSKPKYSNYNRLPIHIERAIYRLSHVKLANPRRPLHEQVLISNMMFWYLGVIQQQQMLQQQTEQQQQQAQRPKEKGSEEGNESKSKNKPKKRKSQKKKNQQRGSSKSAERIVKSPDYEKQQEHHNNAGVNHVARSRQQGSRLSPVNPAPNSKGVTQGNIKNGGESQIGGGNQDFSDYEGSEVEGSDQQLPKQQIGSQSDTLTTLSIKSPPRDAQEDEGDDDARGPKKHLKRLNAPKHWMLDKLTGTYAPRPTAGPHKLRECLPLIILLRNRLKYALNGKEVQSILMQRLVKVDAKVRTDTTFPAGFMDAITIEKTGENFRLVYDTKGRFTVHRITAEEAKYKLCKVKKVQLGAKGIPFVVTHDGRTIRYPDPLVKVNDTIKLDLESGKFVEFAKFEVGNVAMVTGGRNTGRVGVITHKERHVGGFDIVHIKDVLDRQFATRLSNVFVIGEGNKPWVSLPKNKGVKLTIAEERDRRRAAN